MDASRFVIPAAPTAFFLFNPFRPPVLIPVHPVLRNVNKFLTEAPRNVILIYVGPFHAQLIESETSILKVDEGPHHKMYRFTPA